MAVTPDPDSTVLTQPPCTCDQLQRVPPTHLTALRCILEKFASETVLSSLEAETSTHFQLMTCCIYWHLRFAVCHGAGPMLSLSPVSM